MPTYVKIHKGEESQVWTLDRSHVTRGTCDGTLHNSYYTGFKCSCVYSYIRDRR